MPAKRKTAGPPDAKINAKGYRTYRWGDQELLSVTSIRKLLGEPFGLVYWQIGKVADRAVSSEFLDRLMPILAGATVGDGEFARNETASLKKWLRAATTEDRDKAAGKGLDIHGAFELGLSPEECNEETRPYVKQGYHFLSESGYEIVAHEAQTFNLSVGYAGTLDVLLRDTTTGEYVIGDWKTSKGVYVDHVIQLHAYLGAEFIGTHGVVDEKLTEALRSAKRAAIIHLAEDSWAEYRIDFREDVMMAFLGAVQFAKLMAANEKPDALFSGKREGSAG